VKVHEWPAVCDSINFHHSRADKHISIKSVTRSLAYYNKGKQQQGTTKVATS
jgi:hypothetical protein